MVNHTSLENTSEIIIIFIRLWSVVMLLQCTYTNGKLNLLIYNDIYFINAPRKYGILYYACNKLTTTAELSEPTHIVSPTTRNQSQLCSLWLHYIWLTFRQISTPLFAPIKMKMVIEFVFYSDDRWLTSQKYSHLLRPIWWASVTCLWPCWECDYFGATHYPQDNLVYYSLKSGRSSTLSMEP
jgi:hypothetical protein